MSKTRKNPSSKYEPAEPSQFTIAELQDLQNLFQRIGGSRTVKWLAGAAAGATVLQGLHVLWLAGRYLLGR